MLLPMVHVLVLVVLNDDDIVIEDERLISPELDLLYDMVRKLIFLILMQYEF